MLEEDLDQIINIMRKADYVFIRHQFQAYAKPQEDIAVGDLVYTAVIPAVGNCRKQVNMPRTYTAHISKLCLCKKLGEKDINPIFKLPRPPIAVNEELLVINLPCLVNDDLIGEFWDELLDQGGQRYQISQQ